MIQDFADWLVYGIMGLQSGTPLGSTVNFFFYDSIKIVLLLFVISAIMGVVNAYFPVERLRTYLATHKLYGLQYLCASLFGAICVCAKGVPLGTAIAFMMGVVGLSLPEATMLKKVMTWRLIAVFFGVVALFIILLGYLFNLIL